MPRAALRWGRDVMSIQPPVGIQLTTAKGADGVLHTNIAVTITC